MSGCLGCNTRDDHVGVLKARVELLEAERDKLVKERQSLSELAIGAMRRADGLRGDRDALLAKLHTTRSPSQTTLRPVSSRTASLRCSVR